MIGLGNRLQWRCIFLLSVENNFLSEAAASSWKRCHQLGLMPTDPIDDDILTGSHMQSLLRQNEQSIQYTEQIFEQMHTGIKQSGQMALLIDSEGTIIHTVGDIDFSRRALAVQLQSRSKLGREKKRNQCHWCRPRRKKTRTCACRRALFQLQSLLNLRLGTRPQFNRRADRYHQY